MYRMLSLLAIFACSICFAQDNRASQNSCTSTQFLKELRKSSNVWMSTGFQDKNGMNSYRKDHPRNFFAPVSFVSFNKRGVSAATFGSDYFPARISRLEKSGLVLDGVIYGVAPPDVHEGAVVKLRKYSEHAWKYTILIPHDCQAIDLIVIELKNLESPTHRPERVILDRTAKRPSGY
jgi:hypothetical protein